MYIKSGSFQNLLSGAPQAGRELANEKWVVKRKKPEQEPLHFNYLKEKKFPRVVNFSSIIYII
jgi:hypothetical protein